MVDRQHRPMAQTGSGPMSWEDSNIERRERQKKLALESIDITKDPYFMRNNIGSYECKLCLTLHQNEGSYLAHTQGKKHQSNQQLRLYANTKLGIIGPTKKTSKKVKKEQVQKPVIRIGRPGYRVIKQYDPDLNQRSLLFEIEYFQIDEGFVPRHRIMSPWEQKIEPINRNFQYLVFAADPYDNIAFKIPFQEVDLSSNKFYYNWDSDSRIYTLQLFFKEKPVEQQNNEKTR